MRWAVTRLGHLGKPVWVVADRAYAKAPFLKPMRSLGVTVVSRLRKDSSQWMVPGPRPRHRRGPDRIYGERRIDLAKRAGQRRGWATGTFTLYGKATEKKYKTFVATWRPAGGAIRVVLVDEGTGWVAFFCTDPAATVGRRPDGGRVRGDGSESYGGRLGRLAEACGVGPAAAGLCPGDSSR